MIQFTSNLKKEVDIKIEQIENTEVSMVAKAQEAFLILGKPL